MTLVAHQVGSSELGAGRYRVELELPRRAREADAQETAGGPSATPADAAGPPARVEAVAAPPVGRRDRLSVVLAVEGGLRVGHASVYDLSGGDRGGWSARVELGPGVEEPAPPGRRGAVPPPPADVDYTARDFDALREMMLGLIAERVPGDLVGHPVAQTTALVEQLAYLGDALSYAQDAIATEAYLASARQRVSATRHAALLDYRVFEGRSARAWVRIDVAASTHLPARTRLVTRVDSLPARLDAAGLARAREAGALVFETLEPALLAPAGDGLPLAVPYHAGGRLTAGATAATVAGTSAALEPGVLAVLAAPGAGGAGHVVRLDQVRVEHGGREPVTVIGWPEADALPANPLLTGVALRVLTGNLVLAEHGETQRWSRLDPPAAVSPYRPRLPLPGTSFTVGLVPGAGSAAEVLVPAEVTPCPAVELRESTSSHLRHWHPRPTLLASGPMAADFVVEVENDRHAQLRFGDDVNGMRPPPGARLEVRQRVGGGPAGNVGPAELAHVVTADDRVRGVHNPAAACGGAEPETLASVRLNAPEAFRTTERVVSAGDYVAQALRVPGVAGATAVISSTGSWPVAVVYVRADDWSLPVDAILRRTHERLALRQPAAVGLEVRRAVAMPVSVELEITVLPAWDVDAALAAVDDRLRSAFLAPGRFGFGDALHRSDLVSAVAGVAGVADVTVRRFGWFHAILGGEPPDLLLPPLGHVIRIDDDVRAPEHGSIRYAVRRAG